ncbi:sce7726 family protein [Cedecea colo]|uniref:Sce7726 family protein n=1 Tax=Cedecea colo TaxID=2552946 RepID=A0ABX0VRB6_9ENTR|nr:sce7726 family protein [Cedecea colo]NIY48805.1 hypothetical protein [Cedecea colo]
MLNPTQISALSRIFSAAVFSEMALKGYSALFTRLLWESELLPDFSRSETTIGDAFDSAFTLLRKSGIRNEYVYRAALTHNLLLGKHSLRTASLLTEFRIGSCKADMIILNGTGTVYEIKSDRDSLVRLDNQIINYKKAFSKIYVIAGSAHIDEILDKTPKDIGVLKLVRWNRISTIREAIENTESICSSTICESLRLQESLEVLNDLGIDIPQVSNIKIRGVIKDLFADLDPKVVHQSMIKTLKRTRNLAPLRELLAQLPKALQPAALSAQLRTKDHERLIKTLNQPLDEALKWV